MATSGDHKQVPRPSFVSFEDRGASLGEEEQTRPTDAPIALSPLPPARHRTRATLTVVRGPQVGRVFAFRDRESVIGRGREAHMLIEDGGASRAHARVYETEEGSYVIEDLGSKNGTFVGGQRIQRAELTSGDRIQLGPNVVMSFAILDAQAERLTQELYESSVRDPLTRAYNRRYLLERLVSEIAFARRHKSRLALLILDIDHFKTINDSYGHLAGDDVLRELANLVQRMIRTEDVFARLGGEEFVVVVRGISHANVGRFAERLRVAVSELQVFSEGTTLRLTVSVGFALLDELPEESRVADGMLRLADERLYRVKSGGRNGVCGA
jgi:two-component system cell cycle response regulator